jgi:hypothetical protein
MKNWFFYLFLNLFIFLPVFSDEIKTGKNNYEVKEGFCHNRGYGFSDGILVRTDGSELYSLSDGELIFYNKKRKDNIKYKNFSIAVIEDTKNKKRFYYQVSECPENPVKKNFAKDEKILDLSNPNNIYLKVEDTISKKMINPLSVINIEDNKNPFIDDVYFITKDNDYISFVKSYSNTVKRGGRVYIKCFDRINKSVYNVTPYKIKLFIDGKELSNLIFDSLDKSNNEFLLHQKKFSDIYNDNTPFNYFLAEYNGLPGVVGLIIEIEDIKGNKTVYKRPMNITFSEK